VAPPSDAEGRALAYLSREVPLWSRANNCFSCHNNGDAARALYAAVCQGRSLPTRVLADTTRWLQTPGAWDKNGGQGPFSDKKLARLQFAAALIAAHDAGLAKDRPALTRAGRLVAAMQDDDGSWRVVPDNALGGPTTYGNALATYIARTTLQRAGAAEHSEAIRRADTWLRKAPVETVLDAAVALLAFPRSDAAHQRRCLDRIRKGESREGGWGPYVNSAPQVFDTALVLLALAGQEQAPEVIAWRKRGRYFLLATQEQDGSWPETTRPSGADSYAQRLSTSGWATLALLSTSR